MPTRARRAGPSVLTFFPLLVACSVETSGLERIVSRDAGPDGSAIDGATDGGTDAGEPAIVGPVPLGLAGPRSAHPAIVWTGAEFVVAWFVDDGVGGQQVVAAAARPGEALSPAGAITVTSGVARSSLSLAHSTAETAIGWVEGGGVGELLVRILPSTPRGSFAGVETRPDFDDALLMWDRGGLLAVARQRDGANEKLTAAEFLATSTTLGSVATGVPRFGELASASTSAGPVIVSAEARRLWLRGDDLLWREAHTLGLGGMPLEGDVVEVEGSALLGVFSVADGTGRTLRSQRLEPGGPGTFVAPVAEMRLSNWLGPDPVVTTLGPDRVLLAWVDETADAPPRPLALAVLDAAGLPQSPTPCLIPMEKVYANDPDIACGAGWCAAIWIEATTLDGLDYATRFVQLPMVGDSLLCPAGG